MTTFDRLRVLTRLHDLRDRPDAELLRLFADARDEAAFELLVRRHGPLVLGVCRRALGDHAAADDVFQATFLLLARRAPSLREPAAVAGWLYGTAARTAREALRHERRRRRRERRAAKPERVAPADNTAAAVDAAVRRLPEPFRTAVLLCDLGGRTRDDVARELDVPAGTVASRVSRGRALLAADLTRRGVTLAAVAGLTVPPELTASTTRIAILVASGERAATVAPAAAALLGGSSVVSARVLLAAGLAVAVTAGGVALYRPAAVAPAPAEPPSAKPVETAPPPRPAESPAEKLSRLKREYRADDAKNQSVVSQSEWGRSVRLIPFSVSKYLTPLGDLSRGADEAVAFDAFLFMLEVHRRDQTGLPATLDAFLARFARTDYARRMVHPLRNGARQNVEAVLLKFADLTTDRTAAADALLTAASSQDSGQGVRPKPGTSLDHLALMAARRERAILLYERVIADYANELDEWNKPLADGARERLGRIRSASPGLPAPKTVGVDLDGRPLDLADFRGKPVVLYFWNPGGACDRETTHMLRVAERYAGRAVVLGVTGNRKQQPDDEQTEARQRGMTWQSFFDPYRLDPAEPKQVLGPGPVHAAWFTRTFPTATLIAADGTIDAVGIHVAVVDERLDALLKPPAKP